MNSHDELEHRLEAFYATEAPQRAPDWLLQTALATVDITTQQRGPLRLVRRTPALDTRLRLVAAAAAVIVIAIIGYRFLPSPGGIGGELTPSPLASPSPPPSFAPTVTLPTTPPLTQTFDSTIGGISISYPEGWTTQAATVPATSPNAFFLEAHSDYMYDPVRTDHLFLSLVSVNAGASSPEEWIADNSGVEGCGSTEPVTIDGVAGAICSSETVALVSTQGRGYVIWLYKSADEGWLDDVYDRAWFESLLATVQLRPEDAIDLTPAPS